MVSETIFHALISDLKTRGVFKYYVGFEGYWCTGNMVDAYNVLRLAERKSITIAISEVEGIVAEVYRIDGEKVYELGQIVDEEKDDVVGVAEREVRVSIDGCKVVLEGSWAIEKGKTICNVRGEYR